MIIMAIINLRIKPKELKKKGLELNDDVYSTFNIHTLSDSEAKLVFKLLKDFAYSPLGCLPKQEVIKRRDEIELARFLYEEFKILFDLGMVRIDFRKDSPYPF